MPRKCPSRTRGPARRTWRSFLTRSTRPFFVNTMPRPANVRVKKSGLRECGTKLANAWMRSTNGDAPVEYFELKILRRGARNLFEILYIQTNYAISLVSTFQIQRRCRNFHRRPSWQKSGSHTQCSILFISHKVARNESRRLEIQTKSPSRVLKPSFRS